MTDEGQEAGRSDEVPAVSWPERFAAGPGGRFRTPLFWGFAEASFFVLVPDIAITFVALFAGLRPGLRAAGWAVLGAVAGGTMVYLAPHAWQSFFPHLPGVPEAMMDDAARRLADEGWWAVVVAPLSGLPYKLYAAEVAIQGRPLWQLVLVTPVARGWRFILVAVIAWGVGWLLRTPSIQRTWVGRPVAIASGHLAAWVLVYALYFRSVAATYG